MTTHSQGCYSLARGVSQSGRLRAALIAQAACRIAHLPFLLVLGGFLPASPVSAQIIRENLWVTNGHVYAVGVSEGILYVGGSFSRVGPAIGGAVAIDNGTGIALSPYPLIDGYAAAVAADGSGGWYIGGSFSTARGQSRNNLAHIDASGNVSSWNPNSNNGVHAIAVNGNTVYVAGGFSDIGGKARNGLAAVDATTGEVTSWDPAPGNQSAAYSSLAVKDDIVYVGGGFASIGGQVRNGIAALDATTGTATSWNPDLQPSGGSSVYVTDIAVGGDVVYFCGGFATVGGTARNGVAAADASTGVVSIWDPNPDCCVGVLDVEGSAIYAGGSFTFIGGQTRGRLSSLDLVTGAATGLNPNLNGAVSAIAVDGGTVYAGGAFTSARSVARRGLVALDASTMAATGWDPNPHQDVLALATSAGKVFAGGWFTSIGGEARSNLAAFDLQTGLPTSWAPNANSSVAEILVHGNTIYVGGHFTSIGGQARNHIAAIDPGTGLPNDWNPDLNASVWALAAHGSTIYAGGTFTSVGGQPRNYIVAIDSVSGTPTAWHPDANDYLLAIAVDGNRILAGGAFTRIGGQTRNRIAALDATTGLATPWNPNANGRVDALAIDGATVYAGGQFTAMGGQARNCIAALDNQSGAPTGWSPSVGNEPGNERVAALAVNEGTVYAGGFFSHVGDRARGGLAAIDALTGAATDWNPSTRYHAFDLAVSGGTLYVGGPFWSIGGLPHSSVAGVTEAVVSVDKPSAHPNLDPVAVAPNPFRSSVGLQFSVPHAGQADVSVYDLRGRLVRLLCRARLSAGSHRLTWDGMTEEGGRVGAGLYFVRVRTGDVTMTGKLVRLR